MTSEDPARAFAPDAATAPPPRRMGQVDAHVFLATRRRRTTTRCWPNHGLGSTGQAIARMRRAIDETEIRGVQTNLDFLALFIAPRFEAETSALISWSGTWPKCSRWMGTSWQPW